MTAVFPTQMVPLVIHFIQNFHLRNHFVIDVLAIKEAFRARALFIKAINIRLLLSMKAMKPLEPGEPLRHMK